MGSCFSSPSKSHQNTTHGRPRYEVAPGTRLGDSNSVAPPSADRITAVRKQAKRKPVPPQPQPTHSNQHPLTQNQSHQMQAFDASSQALAGLVGGPSRQHCQSLGLRVTTAPYSGQPMDPGNVSPVSIESTSEQGGVGVSLGPSRINRMLTTGKIRQQCGLPPRRRGTEIATEEEALKMSDIRPLAGHFGNATGAS